MKPECSATIFHVKDREVSAKYYIDILGFTHEFTYWDLSGFEYGAVLIYLSGPKQDVNKIAGQGSIYIFCDEVDDYYKDISAKGARISMPLEDRAYGMRDFSITDPDGNLITFGKSVEKSEPQKETA